MTLMLGFLGLHVSGDMSVGDLLVGFGTLALAGFTWRLATQTTKDVEATTESLRLTREGLRLSEQSIEAADMPYVIPTAPEKAPAIRLHSDGLWLSLWNIGKGPAILCGVSLQVDNTRILEPLAEDVPLAAGIATEMTLARVTSTHVPEDKVLNGHLELRYRHANGSVYQTTCAARIERAWVTCNTFARSPDRGPDEVEFS